MLDKIIDQIIKKIHDEVVTPKMDRIPLTYIMTRKIPDSVKHFFDQEVELWLREESEKFVANDKFDYDMPEVRVLVDRIFDVLKQTATFRVAKFNQLLERAIKLESNYLIRPHQTLTQFLFKDSYVITTIDVYDMLKYFDKFQYYKDALTDYFNLKYMREISQNQFEELIQQIDHQVFSQNHGNAVLQTVKTMINFLNEGRQESDSLPVDVLVNALQDRNLNADADLVLEETNGNDDITLEVLENLLSTGKTTQQIAREAEEKNLFETIQDIETEKPTVQVDEIEVEEQVSVPQVEEYEEEFEESAEAEESEEFEEIEEAEEEEISAKSQVTVADQLADVVGSKIKGDHLEDLNRLINPKQRKRFIKKVFHKDEAKYRQFINSINKLPDWKEASVAIDAVFYQAGINPYSSEALEFSDIIYNRYFPKDVRVNREAF